MKYYCSFPVLVILLQIFEMIFLSTQNNWKWQIMQILRYLHLMSKEIPSYLMKTHSLLFLWVTFVLKYYISVKDTVYYSFVINTHISQSKLLVLIWFSYFIVISCRTKYCNVLCAVITIVLYYLSMIWNRTVLFPCSRAYQNTKKSLNYIGFFCQFSYKEVLLNQIPWMLFFH